MAPSPKNSPVAATNSEGLANQNAMAAIVYPSPPQPTQSRMPIQQQQPNMHQQGQYNPQLARQQQQQMQMNMNNPINRVNPPAHIVRNNSAPMPFGHGWQLPSSQPMGPNPNNGMLAGTQNPMLTGSTQFVTSPSPQQQSVPLNANNTQLHPNKRLA
ncbi:UNVERIFIED_CONTAM: hypothetical protein HDU68_008441, partial [Siphonaria sp. JEL0065]